MFALRRGVLLLSMLSLCGCGGSEYPVAPVSGQVTLNGEPVTFGNVVFKPVGKSGKDNKPGKAAVATLDDNGNYTLTTYKFHDGAVVGPHIVYWIPPGAEDLQEDIAEGGPKPTGELARRITYGSPIALEFEVKPGNNQFNFEISEGQTKPLR